MFLGFFSCGSQNLIGRERLTLKETVSLSNAMRVVLLLCMRYYAFGCCFSFYDAQPEHGLTLGAAILFGSGSAGIEISAGLLVVSTVDVRMVLGFLLSINGVLSAVGWILLGTWQIFILLFFLFGLAQFLCFSCLLLQNNTEVKQ